MIAAFQTMKDRDSDVNLAVHLLNDAWKGCSMRAAVFSNDTDLVVPIRMVAEERKLPASVVCPGRWPFAPRDGSLNSPWIAYCEALSLTCNRRLRHEFSWHDMGDLQGCNTDMYSGPVRTDAPDYEPSVKLSQQHLDCALHVHLKLHAHRKTRPALCTAVY